MPRYGPGQQSRSAPKPRKSGRAGPAAPARPKAQAQREGGIGSQPRPKRAPGSEAAGKAKLRQGSFDPSNREQQTRLRQESQQEGQRVAAQRRRERVQRAAQSLYKQGKRKEAISLAEREGLGTGSHDPLGKFLSAGYGAVRKAEKIPVAGELIGMADPILLGKTAVRNIKALPKIGTSEYGKGQVNAGMVVGKGGEAPKPVGEGALRTVSVGGEVFHRKSLAPEKPPEHVAAPHQRPAPLSPQARGKAEKRLAQIDAANAKVFKGFVDREEVAGARELQGGRNMTKRGRAGPTVTKQREQHAQAKLSQFLEGNAEHPVVKAYVKREAEGNRLRELLNPPEDFFAHRPEEGLADFLRQAKAAEPHLRRQTEKLAKAAGVEFKHGPSKTAERTLKKAKADYGGNLAKVKDAARSRIIVDSPEQAQAIREQAKASGNLVGVKDRLRLSGQTGYGDLKLYLKHEGHVTELQVVPRPVHEVQQRLNGLYQQRRALPASREAEAKALAKKMHGAYAEAFRTFERKSSNALRSIGTPSESANSRRTERGGSVSQASIPRESSYDKGIPSASKKVGRAAVSGSATELLPDVAPSPSIRAAEARVAEAQGARAKMRGSLGPARARQAAQEGLRREERGKRTARAAQAYEEAGGGIAGQRALKGQLRGELPKVQFRHLREGKLSQDELEQLMHDIDQHPKLSFYDKLSAREGLLRAYENGTVPQKAQLEKLSTVFGQDVAAELARVSKLRKAGHVALDVAQIPRSMMASADLSFPFRQGLVAGAIDPKSFGRNFAPMIRSFGQEGAYQRVLSDIHADPRYEQAIQSGVKFTELGGRDNLKGREEYFPSQIAEKIPITGHVVRASGRAFTAFADKERMDLFNYMVDDAAKKGVNVEDRAQLRGIARVVNNATGRGDLGPLEDWAPALNTLFFAPRLIASRVNFLNPFWYASLTPYARRQAIKGMIRLSSAAAVTLGLGSLVGARVGTDPRSADFAKLRIGDTRIDALGGFPQYVRLVSQIATGKIISSTTGKSMPLGPGFGKTTKLDIIGRFAWSKSSPPASFVHDFFKGTDFNNQPFDVKKAALQRLIPLAIQDAYDLQKTSGSVPAALGGYGLSAVGFGVQSYSGKQYVNQKISKTKKNHDAYGKAILEGAIKTGLLPKGAKLTPALTKALAVREARYVNREKMDATDTRSRFEADVRFLEKRKIIPGPKADFAVKWAHDEKRDYLVERELRRLSDWYFDDLYGDALADARQKLRDRGYDLPRAPR